MTRNTQSIAFLCGRAFIFVFACREKGIEPTSFMNTDNLARIYPQELNIIEWPTKDLVTEKEMSKLAWALDELKISQCSLWRAPHSMSKCNGNDFCWSFIAQAFPGSVVNP